MISGRVWKFGDSINTDLMMPGPALYLPQREQIRYVFQANRPGWVDTVKKGDIIIGGNSYGVGSSRPAALSLLNIGIGCLLAEVDQRTIFPQLRQFRFASTRMPSKIMHFEEGQIAEVSTGDFIVRNVQTGAILKTTPVPQPLLDLMSGGESLSSFRSTRINRTVVELASPT